MTLWEGMGVDGLGLLSDTSMEYSQLHCIASYCSIIWKSNLTNRAEPLVNSKTADWRIGSLLTSGNQNMSWTVNTWECYKNKDQRIFSISFLFILIYNFIKGFRFLLFTHDYVDLYVQYEQANSHSLTLSLNAALCYEASLCSCFIIKFLHVSRKLIDYGSPTKVHTFLFQKVKEITRVVAWHACHMKEHVGGSSRNLYSDSQNLDFALWTNLAIRESGCVLSETWNRLP